MLALYAITVFLSAALLFSVQPMFARLVLPLLGGTPAVWNTCLVFFQATLLAGYAYAHASTAWWSARRQSWVHVLLVLAPLAVLPIGLPRGWSPPSDTLPIPWLLGLLTVSVAAPLFVVSTTAPLLQKWFAESGHRESSDPYFLYAASNLGSMVALVGFPTLIEPTLRLRQQAWLWAAGYAVLAALVAACAWLLQRAPRVSRSSGSPPKSEPVTAKRRLRWLALSLVPSSWLLGVTTHLTTDIAPVPLLWVIPLALYLLSFILVFARRPPLEHDWIVRLFALPILLLAISVLLPGTWHTLVLHLAAFFVGALMCHGELARDRPATSHLTEYYLWLSIGGVLGGTFNALVAPLVFPRVLEYPLAIVAACLLLPAAPLPARGLSGRRFEIAGSTAVVLTIALFASGLQTERPVHVAVLVVVSVPLLLALYLLRRPKWFALAAALPLMVDKLAPPFTGEVLYAARGYFGVHAVIANSDEAGRYHHLVHGATIHGRQCRLPDRQCEPLTYYHRTGPLGQVFASLEGAGGRERMAVVGLGSGAMACYATASRHFTFYEIDPIVRQIAETPAYFSYLSDCTSERYRIVLGDGRLKLAEAAAGEYTMIILDAFSSDAVPVHLLTREAIELYLSKLADGGLLVFHTTNTHLDLESVLGNLAADLGLACLAGRDLSISPAEFATGKTPSTYVVMARHRADLGSLAGDQRWQPVAAEPGAAPWTDDFSNVVGALKWWRGDTANPG